MPPAGVDKFTNMIQVAFHMKVFCAAFMRLQFMFVIFWQKEISTKAGRKMLVKLHHQIVRLLPNLWSAGNALKVNHPKQDYES